MKNLNKYIHSYFAVLLLLLVSAGVFSSCSDDNPVKPVEDFAPPRFNWRTLEITGKGFAGAWAMDTGNIFLLNHNSKLLYKVSGGNVPTYYVGEYYLNEIKGISNNEIYLFGTQIGGNMSIIKWNGAGFQYYSTDTYVTGFNVNWVRGCAVSSNEIWICSQNGISRFDGANMTDYSYEDSLLIPLDLFLTNDNKVQYIAERWIDTSHIQQSLFEFRDSSFVRIYNEIILPYPSRSGIFLAEVGGIKYGLEFNEPLGMKWSVCINYFIDSSFINYFCFNNKINSHTRSQSQGLVGINLQNFIYLALSNEQIFENAIGNNGSSELGIVFWDGNKVSKEVGLRPYDSGYPYDSYILQNINLSCYLVLCPFSENINSQNSTLVIGTKK